MRLLHTVHPLFFADGIALLSGTMANAQTLLTAVEEKCGCRWFAHQHEEDRVHQNWRVF